MKINLKYPMTKENDLHPWYKIIWKVSFVPLIALGLFLAYLGILFSHGIKYANEWVVSAFF